MQRKWYSRDSLRALVFRFFGALHLLFAAVGTYFVIIAVAGHLYAGRTVDLYSDLRFVDEAFYFRTSINVFLLALQTLAALWLWRLHTNGVRLTNVFCITLHVYVSFGLFFRFDEAVNHSLAATAGTGNMGIVPQVLIGYPFISFVALNLVARTQAHNRDQSAKQGLRPGIVVTAVWALLLGAFFVGTAVFIGSMVEPETPDVQLVLLIPGTILVVAGVELFFSREWARFAMIPIAAFLTWAGSPSTGWSTWAIPVTVFFLTFHTWMIWYLLRRWNSAASASQAAPLG